MQNAVRNRYAKYYHLGGQRFSKQHSLCVRDFRGSEPSFHIETRAMAQPRRSTGDDRAVIIHLMQSGYSASAAAREVGRDRRTVSLWWRRHNEEGDVRDRHAGGNVRATTAEETRQIIEYARREKFVTAPEIKRALNLECSLDTIRR